MENVGVSTKKRRAILACIRDNLGFSLRERVEIACIAGAVSLAVSAAMGLAMIH